MCRGDYKLLSVAHARFSRIENSPYIEGTVCLSETDDALYWFVALFFLSGFLLTGGAIKVLHQKCLLVWNSSRTTTVSRRQ